MATFETLKRSIENFRQDRPSMEKNNTDKRVGKLLASEGFELRERMQEILDEKDNQNHISEQLKRVDKGALVPDEDAMYELADIAIFAITLLQVQNRKINDFPLELASKPSQARLLQELNLYLGGIDFWSSYDAVQECVSPEIVEHAINEVLRCSMMLIASMGENPIEICSEKVGHNVLRYPATNFVDGDYETNRKECKKIVKKLGYENQFRSSIKFPTEEELKSYSHHH